ncbi:MAG: ornithine cyclodeaminase family protein [Chloroflexota bacterium]
MTNELQIINVSQIHQVIEIEPTIAAIKAAFIAHEAGQLLCPSPMQILFHDDDGALSADCHVKAAQPKSSGDQPYFAIKVASGFYNNPAKGLPVNNGLVMLFSAETGAPVALFRDEGWLTSYRTAAAGALAAGLRASNDTSVIGIVGTGSQAELQALWVSAHLNIQTIVVWGRNRGKAEALQQRLSNAGLQVSVAESTKALCEVCDVVVTTTPATSPVLANDDVPGSLHIVAVGADSPGKVELDPRILERANAIVTDDHAQCLHHGEFGAAARDGWIDPDSDHTIGDLLTNGVMIEDRGVSVVDLTGMGIQDLAIAQMVYERLQA